MIEFTAHNWIAIAVACERQADMGGRHADQYTWLTLAARHNADCAGIAAKLTEQAAALETEARALAEQEPSNVTELRREQ